jgi:hypothetical protein
MDQDVVLKSCSYDTAMHLVSKLATAAATLDSDFPRKIPREKFRTKIYTPRSRENVRRTEGS